MNNIGKILKWITLVIALVAVYFFVRILTNGDDAIRESADLQNSIVGGFISFTYVILILTALVAVVASIWSLLKHPKMLKRVLIGIAAFLILFAIAYMMSDDSKVVTNLVTVEQGGQSKFIEAGIRFSLILGGLAFFGFIFDSIRSLIKN
jgi:glucan phosphoethanolaminetransferase (alkaline phosphatase superfamily)